MTTTQVEETSLEGLPVEIAPELYGLRVRDDSFQDALINAGDVVVVARQNTANNGDMVVALIDGANLVIRQYTRIGNFVYLDSPRPNHAPYVRDPNWVEIQGRVVAVIRQF